MMNIYLSSRNNTFIFVWKYVRHLFWIIISIMILSLVWMSLRWIQFLSDFVKSHLTRIIWYQLSTICENRTSTCQYRYHLSKLFMKKEHLNTNNVKVKLISLKAFDFSQYFIPNISCIGISVYTFNHFASRYSFIHSSSWIQTNLLHAFVTLKEKLEELFI